MPSVRPQRDNHGAAGRPVGGRVPGDVKMNVIERLNGEFRRRVKTQGSLPSEDAALLLLFGLIATG
jgi:hypothetical protein